MTALSSHGDYGLVQRYGQLLFSAGFTPRVDGQMVQVGTLGVDADERDAKSAAALATSRALAAMRAEIPTSAGLRILHLAVFVRCAPEVTAISNVADAASATIREDLDQTDPPARTATGAVALPGGALVEVTLIGAVLP